MSNETLTAKDRRQDIEPKVCDCTTCEMGYPCAEAHRRFMEADPLRDFWPPIDIHAERRAAERRLT